MKGMFNWQSKSKQVTDLKTEIKRWMFSEKGHIIMSDNPSSFMMIMSAFNNYEKNVS